MPDDRRAEFPYRRTDWPTACESCETLKARSIVFAHDLPDWPDHWSATYLVCEPCAPPHDLSVRWTPWEEKGVVADPQA